MYLKVSQIWVFLVLTWDLFLDFLTLSKTSVSNFSTLLDLLMYSVYYIGFVRLS